MPTTQPAIIWFRQDLRVNDNPALQRALEIGNALPIYILDEDNAKSDIMGAASKVWLHHALTALNNALNNRLCVFRGNANDIIQQLVQQLQPSAVVWNRCYEPWRIKRDKAIKAWLQQQQIPVESFNASLLWEPWTIAKGDGTPYKVFTPYYRRGCLSAPEPRLPIKSDNAKEYYAESLQQLGITGLNLLPEHEWADDIIINWDISEEGAQSLLREFIQHGLCDYKEGRNFPDKKHTSRLSPYLHFGQISPHQIWYAIKQFSLQPGLEGQQDIFCSELGWREFSYYQLFHFPELAQKNWSSKFDHFPWQANTHNLHRWQRGLTGFPIIDAGMTELWQTGTMHNRVRMIVASFLVKNLLIDWREGAAWFWDCLFDADLASNSASWQWVAGCGADAAPYFRIFNPVTQSTKFDPQGQYIRRYLPQLAALPDKHIHAPWLAPDSVLKAANVVLDQHYPAPMVDLAESRARALAALAQSKEIANEVANVTAP